MYGILRVFFLSSHWRWGERINWGICSVIVLKQEKKKVKMVLFFFFNIYNQCLLDKGFVLCTVHWVLSKMCFLCVVFSFLIYTVENSFFGLCFLVSLEAPSRNLNACAWWWMSLGACTALMGWMDDWNAPWRLSAWSWKLLRIMSTNSR